MLEEDDFAATNLAKEKYSDPRIKHYWDAERKLGGLLSQTLKIKRSIAWDVYLLYPPDHLWQAELPPAPKFWMHQLSGEDETLHLEEDTFTETLKTMIGEVNDK